jgi:hypothetical protein
MRNPLVAVFFEVRLAEVGRTRVLGHECTKSTCVANATRITRPVIAARTMYVRVLTPDRAWSLGFAGTLSARVEATSGPGRFPFRCRPVHCAE